MFFLKRSTLVFLTICTLFNILFPTYSLADESIDPDRLEAIIQGQKDNSELAKRTQQELETMIEGDYNIAWNFLAYRAGKVYVEAYLKEVSSSFNLSRQMGGGHAEFNLRMGVKIYNRLSQDHKDRLYKVLNKVGFQDTLNMFFSLTLLHEDYGSGTNWWEARSSDGNSAARIMKIDNIDDIYAKSYPVIGFIAAMYNARVYKKPVRGHDNTQFQNNVKALLPYMDKNGIDANLSITSDSNHQKIFAGKYSSFKKVLMADAEFLKLFGIALYNPRAIDGSKVMSKVGYHSGYYGKKAGIKLATIVIEEVVMSALEDAAESTPHSAYKGKLGRFGSTMQRAGETAKNLIKPSRLRHGFVQALKWVSRSELTHHAIHHAKGALTGAGLKTLVKHTVTGTAFGIFAEILIESAIVLAVGQHKEEINIGKEAFEYKTQRTDGQGDSNSYWQDRKFAFLDVMDDYADNKEAKV
ncbi:hypothetical protein MJH12_05915, partial [bacterium]|nr:hypothetical protein [bacterium]